MPYIFSSTQGYDAKDGWSAYRSWAMLNTLAALVSIMPFQRRRIHEIPTRSQRYIVLTFPEASHEHLEARHISDCKAEINEVTRADINQYNEFNARNSIIFILMVEKGCPLMLL